jgi:TfoX/Sxy family transcriptional regulator of competence genes
MAYNEQLAARLRKALAHLPNVEEKKMFRGLTFMVNDKMCISVSGDRLMCRIDPEIHEEVIKTEGCETVTMGGRIYKWYVYVNKDCVTTKKDFDTWVGLALAFNKKAKSSKRK